MASRPQWGCALGGQTFFVEGFINHRRFAFSVSNPEQCPQAGRLLTGEAPA
jgi:hypothetical protein